MAYAFEYEGTEYYLEFDRRTVEIAEEALGLTIADVRAQKITTFFKLFHAALLKHHPKIKPSTVEKLYELQDDKVGLHQDLLEMYGETVNTLLDDNHEGNGITRKKI